MPIDTTIRDEALRQATQAWCQFVNHIADELATFCDDRHIRSTSSDARARVINLLSDRLLRRRSALRTPVYDLAPEEIPEDLIQATIADLETDIVTARGRTGGR